MPFEKTKSKKVKKTKRQRPKREFRIATSGQFRTLAMFFICICIFLICFFVYVLVHAFINIYSLLGVFDT